jgi:hypothetical protein
MGKIKLSRKQALSKEELEQEMAMAPAGGPEEEDHRGPRSDRDTRGDRDRGDRDRGPRGPRR